MKTGRIEITLHLSRPFELDMRTHRPEATDEELFGALSDFPLEKTIVIKPKQHFDYIKRNSSASGLKHYEVYRVVSKWHSKILRLRYSDYVKFVNVDCKHRDALLDLVV